MGFYLSEPTPLRIYVSQSSLTENLYKFILATTTTVYLEKQQRQRKFSSAQQGGDFTQTLITGVQWNQIDYPAKLNKDQQKKLALHNHRRRW